MSTSDDIRKMTQKFVEDKSIQNLQGLSLENMSQAWSEAKEAPDAAQQKENMSKNITDEILQNKINEYLVNLNYGRFSPADFSKISEFCEEFGFKYANTDLKNKIETLQETMETCRLKMPKDVDIKLDDKLKAEYAPIPHLDQISISGNESQIKDLEDKKQTIGKTFTFLDDNKNVIGGVEFDDKNDAHILCTNKDGNAVEYKLTNDNKFYMINEDKSEKLLDTKDIKSLSTQDTRAYNLAKASQKTWKKFINKELDKNIQKQKTTFNEGGIRKTQVNEGELEKNAPQATKFDEGVSKPKAESDLDNNTDNETAFPDNKFEWKEDDIIKVMFQDWFLAAANSATSFALNHIEYAAAGIWDTVQKSYKGRQKEEEEKKEQKPDLTHQFYGEVEDVANKSVKAQKDSCDNQLIIDQIKSGNNIQDVVIQNDLLRNFAQQTGVDVSGLLSRGEPEKTVPLMTSMAALYNTAVDTYARTAILDEKMRDVHSFDNTKADALYEQKIAEGGKIVKSILAEEIQKDPQKNNFNLFKDTLTKFSKDMNKAANLAEKDYNKQRYNEHGKEPKENKTLHQYQEHLGKGTPQSLHEFANEQSVIIRNRDFIVSGVNMEQQEIEAAAHDNNLKRQRLKQTKDFILKGLNPEKEMINVTGGNQIVVPLRPQGRE